MKKMITPEMRAELRSDFPIEAYSVLEHKAHLTTLKAMYVTERLNDVFGLGRWTIDFKIIKETEANIVLQGEFISFDYDVNVPKQFGGHALNRKGMELADAYKSAVTDCQSKIASYLEIGIDMFKGKIKIPAKTSNNYNPTYQKPVQQKQATKKPVVKKLQNEIDTKQKKGKVIRLNKIELTDQHENFMDCVNWLAKNGNMAELKKRFNINPLVEKHLNSLASDLAFSEWQKEQLQKQG